MEILATQENKEIPRGLAYFTHLHEEIPFAWDTVFPREHRLNIPGQQHVEYGIEEQHGQHSTEGKRIVRRHRLGNIVPL